MRNRTALFLIEKGMAKATNAGAMIYDFANGPGRTDIRERHEN